MSLVSSLALFFTPGLGPVRIKALYQHCGDSEAVLASSKQDLAQLEGVGLASLEDLGSKTSFERANEELARVAKLGLALLALDDPRYPEALRAIFDPPPVLWVRGDPQALLEVQGVTPRSIGVVGTRKCSAQARAFTATLAHDLATAGVTVVSGLARGVDTEAHSAAIKAGGATIGVLGCGADRIYPGENTTLANAMTVVSAYPVGTPPASHNFPARNRIIAGLSSGSVVVEGDTNSGAMITATAALEAGRAVFAVPGRPGEANARGPHKLIREGAVLIEHAGHVFEELGWQAGPAAPAPDLVGAEASVYAALEGTPLLDEVVVRTGLDAPSVMSALVMLSLAGHVRELPGGRFSRL